MSLDDLRRHLRGRSVAIIWGLGFGGWLLRIWAVQQYRPTCDRAMTLDECRAEFGGESFYRLGGDAVYIHDQADLIADGHWYVNPFTFAQGHVADSAGDPPLYAGILSLFSQAGLDSVNDHRLVSTLCGFALVVLVGLLTRRLAGGIAGIAAAAIAAVHPLMWLNDIMLLSEALYQPLVVVVLWAAYDWIERPDRRRIALLGAAIAVTTMTRGEGIALFGFLVLPLVLWGSTLVRREQVRQIAICWAVGIAVMAPWIGWNLVRFEEPVLITSGTGSVLMAGSCDPAWSGERMGFWDDCFSARDLWDEFDAEFPGGRQIGDQPPTVFYDESLRDNWDREQALDYILDNWTRYPQVAAARMGRTLEVFRVGHTLRMNYELEGRWEEPSIIGLGMYYALVPLTVIGAVVLRRAGQRLWPFAALWITVLFSSATTFGLTRYRVPVDIGMIILSGAAIGWLWDRLKDSASAGRPMKEAT